jgi:transposase-like protein
MSSRPKKLHENDFSCPLCTADHFEPVLAVADDEQFETGLYRCSGCGFAFVNPRRYTRSAAADDQSV